MSEHSSPEERTEMPTGRRLQELRKQGQLHMSTEIMKVTSLLAGFLVLRLLWQLILEDMKETMVKSFTLIGSNEPLTMKMLYNGFVSLLLEFGPEFFAIGITVSVVAALSILLQTNFMIREKKIQVKFSYLNPATGISRIFSANGFMQTLKALLQLAIILPIGYFALKGFAPNMIELIHMSVQDIFDFTGYAIISIFWKVMYVLIILAIIDFFWSKFQWLKQNKMTKDEVKDERKSLEGDEQTKRKIAAKGLQRIVQRINESVPQADVVVTNPTHYAVALKYDRENMGAPIVVAKGRGFLAKRIREIAKQARVPVLERKPLARALYASTEVGSEIPYELFKAVAEVLAYVYRLKNPHQQHVAGA